MRQTIPWVADQATAIPRTPRDGVRRTEAPITRIAETAWVRRMKLMPLSARAWLIANTDTARGAAAKTSTERTSVPCAAYSPPKSSRGKGAKTAATNMGTTSGICSKGVSE
jgi:hypothetical protein